MKKDTKLIDPPFTYRPGTDGDGGGSTASDDDDDGEPEEDAMNMDMDEVDEQGQGQEGRKRKRGQQGRSTRAGRGEVELASDAFLTMPMLLAFLVRACVRLSDDRGDDTYRLGSSRPHASTLT